MSTPSPMPGGSIRADFEALRRQIMSQRITSIAGGRVVVTQNGTMLIPGASNGIRNKSSDSAVCPFGEIITYTEGEGEEATEVTAIRGGVVYCGNKNFNVPHKALDLETAGAWLIYLEIDCESNRDDDNEIILPGIKTSSETDPAGFWQADEWSAGPPETQYPDNQEPEVADGIGTIIIPIGKLTIADGAATLVKVDCGNVTIGQCGGVLSHTRG